MSRADIEPLFHQLNFTLCKDLHHVCKLICVYRAENKTIVSQIIENDSHAIARRLKSLTRFAAGMVNLSRRSRLHSVRDIENFPPAEPLINPEPFINKKPSRLEFVGSLNDVMRTFDLSYSDQELVRLNERARDLVRDTKCSQWPLIIDTYISLIEQFFKFPDGVQPLPLLRLMWPAVLVFDGMQKKYNPLKVNEKRAFAALITSSNFKQQVPIHPWFTAFSGAIAADFPDAKIHEWYDPQVTSFMPAPSVASAPAKSSAAAGMKRTLTNSNKRSGSTVKAGSTKKSRKEPPSASKSSTPSKSSSASKSDSNKAKKSVQNNEIAPPSKRGNSGGQNSKSLPDAATWEPDTTDSEEIKVTEEKKMGCRCNDCDEWIVTIVIPLDVYSFAQRSKIFDPIALENCHPCYYQNADDLDQLCMFLSESMKKKKTGSHWKSLIRKHWQKHHEGQEYPESVVKSVAYNNLEALYHEEAEKPTGTRHAPMKHSFNSFKKVIMGKLADDNKAAEYDELRKIAYSDKTLRKKIIKIIHWYWENKCN